MTFLKKFQAADRSRQGNAFAISSLPNKSRPQRLEREAQRTQRSGPSLWDALFPQAAYVSAWVANAPDLSIIIMKKAVQGSITGLQNPNWPRWRDTIVLT